MPLSKATEVEKAAYKKQAAEDWEQFLLMRAAELMPGGQLVVVCVGFNTKCFDHGKELTSGGHHWCMRDLWQTFVNEGQITETEFIETSFPIYFRTPEEMKVPFQTDDSQVRKAGLHLLQVTDVYEISPLSENTGEPTTEALRAVGLKAASAIRSWSYTTFFNALSSQRTDSDKKNIMENYFFRLPDYLTSSLGWHCYDVPVLAVHIEKFSS